MRKLGILILPITIFIIQLVSLLFETFFDSLGQFNKIVIASILLGLFILYHIRENWEPYVKFEKFEKTKKMIIDKEASIVLDQYRDLGFNLRINIMFVTKCRKFSYSKKPKSNNKDKTRFSYSKEFRTFWSTSNMDFHEDRDLNLTVKQGVCGVAYQSSGLISADLTVQDPYDFNLSKGQLESTKNIKFILSCPIKKMSNQELRLTPKLIGVINIDCLDQGSEILIQDDDFFADLSEKIAGLSRYYSVLL